MKITLPKIITILGVTASGKTSLAVELAKKFGGEIVSADSRQVYKEFDIGTAKPNGSWSDGFFIVDGIPHYLIDCVDPKDDFTLASYKNLAIEKINKILDRKHVPFLVGGTALYLKAVLENWSIPEVAPNAALRKELENKSVEELYQELLDKDPEAAAVTGSKNKRRIIRALEVILETSRKFSEQRKTGELLFDSLKIGLKVEPSELKNRLKNRTDLMLKNGLVDEVEKLSKKYGWNISPTQSIGYQEFRGYFDGQTTLDEVKELIIKNSVAFARRQMTWFKKDKDIYWIKSEKESSDLIKKFLFGK